MEATRGKAKRRTRKIKMTCGTEEEEQDEEIKINPSSLFFCFLFVKSSFHVLQSNIFFVEIPLPYKSFLIFYFFSFFYYYCFVFFLFAIISV